MRLPGAYLSCPTGCTVAFPAAVFSVAVAIAIKLLSALLADQFVIGLLVDIFFVAVPVSHPAGVRAELLLPATLGLHQRLTTILTSLGTGNVPMAVDMGTNGAG